MRLRQIEDCVHLAADTCVVHRCNGTSARRNRLFDQRLVHIDGVWPHIDKNRYAAAQHKGIGRADKCVGRHDDLVTGCNIK